LEVVVGTHPVPQKYYLIHQEMNTWNGPHWKNLLRATIANPAVRLAYD